MNRIIGFEDFRVGQRLKVKGRRREDGAFAAEEVSIRAPASQAIIGGPVQHVDGRTKTLRLLNREFALPDGVVPVGLQDDAAGLEHLKPGERIELKVEYPGLKVLALEKVRAQGADDFNVVELQGDISRVAYEERTLEVLGFDILVDENATAISVDSALAYSPLYKTYFEAVGENQYHLSPQLNSRWGGPFNGQALRQQLFEELVGKIPFAAIVETGTFRGTTTDYMHRTLRVPVFTVELHPQYAGYAKARFRGNDLIKVCNDDSRAFLKRLSEDPGLRGKQVFFYLDAHWGEDLPLLEEVEIILSTWPRSVLMIDDFKVPGDEGYGYDNYGPGRALTLEYLRPLKHLGFAAFFPSRGAASETGRKRGCVVLARAADLVEDLKGLDCLTPRDG